MTLIFAHRGASFHCPENTMAAFQKAKQLGADGIELDVQLSRDHVPVIIHDATLKRTTNGHGLVANKTLSDLQKLSAGSWFSPKFMSEKIPTLDECLAWAKTNSLIVNIELKTSGKDDHLEEKTKEIIEKHQMERRTIISSFDRNRLIKMKMIQPKIETALLYKKNIKKPWIDAHALQTDALHPHYKIVTKKFIQKLHKHGLKVRIYTVNQSSMMSDLLKWNADAIITDRPDLALKIRDELMKRNVPTSLFKQENRLRNVFNKNK